MNFQQLENPQNNIINIAKPRSLALLRMVQTPGPINCDIRILPVELDGRANGAASGGLTELKQAVEYGAVLAHVEAPELTRVRVIEESVGRDGGEELDVLRRVEAADVFEGGGEGAADLHAAVEAVVDDQIVCHADAVGFHRMALAVVVVADCRLVEVRHATLPRVGARRWQGSASAGIHCLINQS